MKISVIIPVYMVEKYLSECVESVLNQDYKNKEIILVDDGSPDGCPVLCDEYARNYSEIIVIHKKNGGSSDARNAGIEKATGDYVIFLDGDDFWCEQDALTKLVKRVEITEADVLNFSFTKFFEDTKERKPYFSNISAMPVELKEKKKQVEYLLKKHLYLSSACNKLIKRELLSENLKFEVGVYSEDIEWSAKLLKAAKSMDFLCVNFYCYRQRMDSISHSINDKKSNDLCEHIIRCIKLADTADTEEKEALSYYAAYQFGTYFIVQAQTEKFQKDCIERLKPYRDILSFHCGNLKLFVLNIGSKFFGYKNFCKIIRFVYR